MDIKSFISFFADPVLRAPTIGCMLMCMSASIIGVLVFLRRQSLIGEVLSHAAYPGLILGSLLFAYFSNSTLSQTTLSFFVIGMAATTSLMAVWLIKFLENSCQVNSDSALCFTLSSFFAIGITLASAIQLSYSSIYRQVLNFLYGQAATMTDLHVYVYGILCILIVAFVIIFYKDIQIVLFDEKYAKSIGIRVSFLNILIYLLVTLAVIIGIRSVGVVLMSSMLIAPAVVARQLTHRLSMMLIIASIVGLVCGFGGVYFSVKLSEIYASSNISFPTGPMIVLLAGFLALLSLIFAPANGLLARHFKATWFQYGCLKENILKTIWKNDPEKFMTFDQIVESLGISRLVMYVAIWQLRKNNFVVLKRQKGLCLTDKGVALATKIIRLHRLWELYLVDYIGMGVEKVHPSAEKMEHILTKKFEKELSQLLDNPTLDPHHQPIPPNQSNVSDLD